jgi:RNA polymerase sigma-70 factor (ECF subfamily)
VVADKQTKLKGSRMQKVAHDFGTLIDRIKAGDDGAMCELVERYGATLERMAEQMVGRVLQPHVDGADAVQAVTITLWVGIRTGRFNVPTPDHFLALAKTLISRQIARYWRSVKTEMAAKVDTSMAETLTDRDLNAALKDAEPEKAMEVDELLDKCLSHMDEIDQRLVKLRFEGYTTSEAADSLQLDSGFLRVRLGRLRRKFANLWPQIDVNS